MIPGRLRRRSGSTAQVADEGPFVSFTDLFIGILFLFLILVAALMLMHQEAMQRAREEAQLLREQIAQLQAELDAITRLDTGQTPFRLAIVYNSYQKASGSPGDWRYSRTVQIFRSPNGRCLENVVMRNNLNLAWKPEVEAQDIPTAGNQAAVQTGAPCALTGAGERWASVTETGGVDRVSADLYSGVTVLHTNEGDSTVDIQYRVLGIYDDSYRWSGRASRLSPPLPQPDAGTGRGSISLN